jgi:anti-sigma B factor antagonist
MDDDFFQLSSHGLTQVINLRLPVALDSNDFDRLNEQLLATFDFHSNARWVLDVSGVAYMGSSVLGLLVNIRQRAIQSGGELILCGLSPGLLRIFRTCCMERLFEIRKTQADAIKAARG